MPTALGDVTKSTFINEVEAHKLHLEFVVREQISSVDVQVYKGMPVKLYTDGTIEPLASGDDAINCIGIAIHDGVSGGRVTVGMKAYCAINASANEQSFEAGPVKFEDYDGTNLRNRFSMNAVTHDDCVGWALTTGTAADDEILVALAR